MWGNGSLSGLAWPALVLAPLLAAATIWDLRWRRVPNAVVLLVLIAGAIFKLTEQGLGQFGLGLAAGFICLVGLWVPWQRGGIGGGDVKLAVAVAVWVGVPDLPVFVLSAGIAGGIVAGIAYAASSRAARADIRTNLKLAALTQELPDVPPPERGRVTVPYALAISAGAVTAFLWKP